VGPAAAAVRVWRGMLSGPLPLQTVDAAISESMFNMLEGAVPELFMHGHDRPPSGSTLTGAREEGPAGPAGELRGAKQDKRTICDPAGVVPSGCWKSKDGHYIIIGGNGNSVYDRLMKAVGRPDMGLVKYATDSERCDHEQEICQVRAQGVARRAARCCTLRAATLRLLCQPRARFAAAHIAGYRGLGGCAHPGGGNGSPDCCARAGRPYPEHGRHCQGGAVPAAWNAAYNHPAVRYARAGCLGSAGCQGGKAIASRATPSSVPA
jgi:hypothetical protein